MLKSFIRWYIRMVTNYFPDNEFKSGINQYHIRYSQREEFKRR